MSDARRAHSQVAGARSVGSRRAVPPRTSSGEASTHITLCPVTAPDSVSDRGQQMGAAMLVRLSSLAAAVVTTALGFALLMLAAQI